MYTLTSNKMAVLKFTSYLSVNFLCVKYHIIIGKSHAIYNRFVGYRMYDNKCKKVVNVMPNLSKTGGAFS